MKPGSEAVSPKKTAATRWSDLCKDPTSDLSLSRRLISLEAASIGSMIRDRNDYICTLATKKDVLDVGVVSHSLESTVSDSWLHGRLHRSSNRCLGVDILEPEVAVLRQRGFDVLCADLTANPLDESFDLIVCGEVLEHLPAPQLMLASLSQMLRTEGRIVVTVPNPWYVNTVLKNVFGRRTYVDNVDHVCWFDAGTIAELAERCGLTLLKFQGVFNKAESIHHSRTLKARMFFSMESILVALGVNPLVFAKTILYELGLPK